MNGDARVSIVDDDESVRTSLARLMRSAGHAVDSFGSGEAYLKHSANGAASCLILDVRMKGMSGLQVQELVENTPRACPIIFLTGHGDIPMSVEAMKKGAFDFFTKPVDDEVLLAAVDRALTTSQRAHDRSDPELQARLQTLTPREFEVMRYVIGGAPNKQIADTLGISLKTVKVHRGRVMHKLGVDSAVALVRWCIDAGIDALEVEAP